MSDPVVKTFAQFDTSSYSAGEVIEIADIRDAVAHGIRKGHSRFRIYETSSVTFNGMEMTSKPAFKPESYKLFVDKILTAADIVAFYEQKIAEDKSGKGKANKSGFMGDFDAQINRQMRDHFKEYPADKPFYDDPFGRGEEFCSLDPGDVAFNRKGEQLWPVPAPSVAVDHKVAPMKPLKLKTPKP